MSQNNGESASRSGFGRKMIALAVVAAVVGVLYWKFGHLLSLDYLAEQEAQLKKFQKNSPILVIGAAFLIYVAVTGFSLPGAAVLTLTVGWYFGFLKGVVLVSFASTTGATMAFLMSRYFFREAVQRRFSERLRVFNEALEREGAFYLFTLRLIPAVPFFVINAVMGLTKLPTWTYWWVSQVGMLPVPDLQTLSEQGVRAVFSPSQLTQITIAFVLLGVFPLATRWLLKWLRPGAVKAAEPAAD